MDLDRASSIMSTNASSIDADSAPAPSYVLRDELAQFCLPKADRDPNRKVAWVNTLCLCVLLIGTIGIQTPAALILKIQSEEPQVVQVEAHQPKPQEFQQRPETEEEEPDQAPREQPVLPTIVALNTVDVKFAMPVEGPTAVAANAALATPPPRVITRPVQPPTAKPQSDTPVRFSGFGKRGRDGFIPVPDVQDLPPGLKKNLPRGSATTEFRFTVTTGGQIINLRIQKPSEHPAWDQFVLDWFQRKGTFIGQETNISFYYNFKMNFPD